jgi:hypothetical protein
MAARPLEVCRLIAGVVAAVRVCSLLAGEQGLKAEDTRGRRPERSTGVEPASRCWSPPGPHHARHASTDHIYGHGALVIKAPFVPTVATAGSSSGMNACGSVLGQVR